MHHLRYIVGIAGAAALGVSFFAFAQMMPYDPAMYGSMGSGYMYPTGTGSTGTGSTGAGTGPMMTMYGVTVVRNGSGTVSGGAISCGYSCSTTMMSASPLMLTATPDAGWVFSGWSGDCSGSSSCTLTVDANKNITATFTASSSGASGTGGFTQTTTPNPTTTGTGTDSGAGSTSSSGGDFTDWSDYGYAANFQDQLEVLSKKPPKPKKTFLGISVFGKSDIQRLPFAGSALGANWRVGGTATDPVAQGTLTGKGSRVSMRVGLYTGSVYAQFDGNKSNWVANYYSDPAGAQRSDLYNGKSGIYQEETATDADSAAHKMGLLLAGQTLFGTYEGGTFFMVDAGALPEVAPASWTGVSIPRGNGPLIPAQKIIELLTKAGLAVRNAFVAVAHAALQSLTPAQVFDRLAVYKKIMSDMQGIQQKFSAYDFNDPNIDYDAVQALVDAYQTDQTKLDYLATQLGRARLFVRGGDWLTTGGSAAAGLVDGGVDFMPATLISETSGPFDFYTVQSVDGKDMVFAGTCTGKNDATTGEQVACALRKPTATQQRVVMAANGAYRALAGQAHDTLNTIESALFAPVE